MQCTKAQNREVGRMNLNIHSKTNPKSSRRGAEEERKEDRRANGGEQDIALD